MSNESQIKKNAKQTRGCGVLWDGGGSIFDYDYDYEHEHEHEHEDGRLTTEGAEDTEDISIFDYDYDYEHEHEHENFPRLFMGAQVRY